MPQLQKQGARVVVVGAVRVGVGRARGEIVSLVDDKQRLRRVETGLLVEEAAVVWGEDVVVVADPDIVEGEGGAGDLVGADAGVGAGAAQGVEVVRLGVVEVELGQPAARPALGAVAQIVAPIANAMEGVVHAMLRFVAHLPDRKR